MVEKITKDLLNKFIIEIKKDENQKKLENDILNPILIKFTNKIYPYIKIVFTVFILNFLLVLIIFIIILCDLNKKYNN